MIYLLAIALVAAGVGLQALALVPIKKLIAQLPAGRLRRRWYLLRVLIYCFIAGYSGYFLVYGNTHENPQDLVVPIVFFLGGWFVLLSSLLSLHTAIDVRRLTILEVENITDPLMNIYNRRYLDRRLADEVARARRYDLPLSILMIDIDHFKKINDTYGHPAGDHVLNYLGKLIMATVRTTDTVARYGGEEILVVASNTPVATAEKLAERLRLAVDSAALETKQTPSDEKSLHITVSIGVAFLGKDVDDVQALVHSADAALYRAKSQGRNCVAVNK